MLILYLNAKFLRHKREWLKFLAAMKIPLLKKMHFKREVEIFFELNENSKISLNYKSKNLQSHIFSVSFEFYDITYY